ncbi:hypothetical protein ACCO45_011268 [Purpureocillium lilacinum]|uniref:Uncharacterized protein n=1 Tax=Purpureocillium lilacinum TaxID=33203 RepID=A0ACC4DH84_PURLI
MSLVSQFLSQIRQHVREQRGDLLASWLQVEPNASQQYHAMAAELRRSFADGDALEAVVESSLPLDDDDDDDYNGGGGGDMPEGGRAAPWPSFQAFVKEYLTLWRDIDHDDLLGAHELLSSLVNACGTAFTHPQYGAMLIQVCKSLSESLARFTLKLNRRPDLTRRLRTAGAGDEDGGGAKSVAESSAEIIQKIFKVCLMDRTAGRRPEGKKACVYMFANLVLKLLFACKRTHLATMIFRNMSASSPPLHLYPAAQRVTYLYYLGRFNFAMNHYLRASLCLEQAYLQTPAQLVSHRRDILTYLVPCNMLLGRFPSQLLLARPEAADSLAPVFLPLCRAVRAGNFVAFQAHLAAQQRWLWERASTSRYAAESRRAATLDLADLHTAATFVQRRLEGWLPSSQVVRGRPHNVNAIFMKAITSNVQRLRANEGLLNGNAPVKLVDVEMMVATLIQQDFMHGFVAHSQGRFAIIGAKSKGPLLAELAARVAGHPGEKV